MVGSGGREMVEGRKNSKLHGLGQEIGTGQVVREEGRE